MTSYPITDFAEELERSLWSDLLDPWFPACFDPDWGFRQDFSRDWTPGPSKSRGIVFQSRMTWVAATIAENEGPRQAEFGKYAEHGVRFLLDRFLEPSGAVLWEIDGKGEAEGEFAQQRHSYGASFALYGFAAAARIGITGALEGGRQVFSWLENHARDSVNAGYFETTDTVGRPLLEAPNGQANADAIGTAYGIKSQNTHLHLLESFTEFARVCDDPLIIVRLKEVQNILCERLFHHGSLHLFAAPDWTPEPGPVSYGHDIEAAHLLMDAAMVLDGELDKRTIEVARALIDHTLDYGYDPRFGAFINLGSQAGEPIDTNKVWWVQAEALLGLIRGRELPGAPDTAYLDFATKTWSWIRTKQIDSEYGGWFDNLTESGEIIGSGKKGHAWKTAYHDGRALLFGARILRTTRPTI